MGGFGCMPHSVPYADLVLGRQHCHSESKCMALCKLMHMHMLCAGRKANATKQAQTLRSPTAASQTTNR